MLRNSIVILSLLLAVNSQAETLEDAWKVALEANHQMKAAQLDSEREELQLQSAQAEQLPQLLVNSHYTQFNETPSAKTLIADKSTQFPMQQEGSVNAQAMTSLPLYTSGRITHGIKSAQAAWQASQAQEQITILNLKMQVAENYIAVLRAEDAMQVVQSHLQSLATHQKDVKNLYEQGVVAKNDVLAADVELLNAQQMQTQAKNGLEIAKARYNQLLSRPLQSPVNLSKPFLPSQSMSLEELTQQALSQRPELNMLHEQINALTEQTQSIKANLLPQIAIQGGYQYQQNRYQAYQGLWMANVGVDWKVFDSSVSYKSDAIERQALAIKEQREEQLGQIQLQVHQAWLDVNEAQQRLQVAKQAIAQANENFSVTNDRYQQGLATHTEVIKAEELRTQTYNNLNNALYDSALADLRLKRGIGEF